MSNYKASPEFFEELAWLYERGFVSHACVMEIIQKYPSVLDVRKHEDGIFVGLDEDTGFFFKH